MSSCLIPSLILFPVVVAGAASSFLSPAAPRGRGGSRSARVVESRLIFSMFKPFAIQPCVSMSSLGRKPAGDAYSPKIAHFRLAGSEVSIRKRVLGALAQECDSGRQEPRLDAGRFETSCSYFIVGTFTGWKVPSLPMAVDASFNDGLRFIQRVVVRGRDEFQILRHGDWDERLFPAGGGWLRSGGSPSEATDVGIGHGRNWVVEAQPGTSMDVVFEPESGNVFVQSRD